MRTDLARGLALAAGLMCPAMTRAENDPLSAIDWLSQSVTAPAGTAVAAAPGGTPAPRPAPDEAPVVKGGALPSDVATSPLDGPSPDAAGLIAPSVSGLPANLWGAGRTEEIARAVTEDRMDSLPALRQLFLVMLLAETVPPADNAGRGILLQTRVDKLMQLGALEQAAALLDVAGADTPELFRRSFDIALLTGNEDRACERMRHAPGLAPTLQARVFCLAREGNWDAAALTLSTAKALGQVTPSQAELLTRFLDPEIENALMPPPPVPLTPLDWKIYDAIGESLPTASLPVAFAYAELAPAAGWKAQIEAAERLTRAGTIAPNVILGLYTERAPAASGGVWDRVEGFQDFDAALAAGDATRMAQTLPVVWARMQEAELEVPFALLYGRMLAEQPALTGEAGAIAYRVGLLSPQAETVARTRTPADETEAFLAGLALGHIEGLHPPDSMARVIAPAFLAPRLSDRAQALIGGNRLGEALLLAIEEIASGVEGNPDGVTEGLSLLRAVGLDGVARRTALELLILERRG
ncbi:MAG: hypothetical protein IAE87_09510 [Rhodobacteraceae bacterium]|jgi:hypothetical protein|nr:hypothetical protein [Paracoccaceae bacterium]